MLIILRACVTMLCDIGESVCEGRKSQIANEMEEQDSQRHPREANDSTASKSQDHINRKKDS